MGTRNLTIVKSGEKLFGQYGQWDGYPGGQGLAVLKFLQKEYKAAEFRKNFENAKFLSDEELMARWKGAGADNSGFVSMDISRKFKDLYPQLSRDAGAEVLSFIQNNSSPELKDSIDFASDSLFCEWAYMLDLDKKKLIVFKGFNKDTLNDTNFFKYLEDRAEGEYEPIKEVGSISFNKAKTISTSDFIKTFDPPEEDE